MYKITLDDAVIFSETSTNNIISANLNLEANKAGSLVFTMTKNHPLYNSAQMLVSEIRVYQDEKIIFYGFPVSHSIDIYKNKTINAEGVLSALNYSIQLPKRLDGDNATVIEAMKAIVTEHRAQMNKNSWMLTVGAKGNVGDINLGEWSANMVTSMEAVQALMEKVNAVVYLQRIEVPILKKSVIGIYKLDEIPDTGNTQVLRFGKNILDYAVGYDVGEIASRVIPLGAKKDTVGTSGEKERIGISSVEPHGRIFIYNEALDNIYGATWKKVVYDKLKEPSAIYEAGLQYMQNQYTDLTLELTALDLGLYNVDVQALKMFDVVHVLAPDYNINVYLPIIKMKINITQPQKNIITLGKNIKKSIAEQSARTATDVSTI